MRPGFDSIFLSEFDCKQGGSEGDFYTDFLVLTVGFRGFSWVFMPIRRCDSSDPPQLRAELFPMRRYLSL